MRVAHFLLMAALGLSSTSAPVGPPELTSGSGLTSLNEPLSNITLPTRAYEVSSISAEEKLRKRVTQKKKSKNGKPRSRKPKKGSGNGSRKGVGGSGKKSKEGTFAYELAQKAAKNALKPKLSYLFHETFGMTEYLFVAQITPEKDLRIKNTMMLSNTGKIHPNLGERMCEADFEDACLGHKFIMYSCIDGFVKRHTISKSSKLEFFQKEKLQYSHNTFLLKTPKKTTAFEFCADEREGLGKPDNTGKMKYMLEEYYPGGWTQGKYKPKVSKDPKWDTDS